MRVWDLQTIGLAALGVLFIGLAKAGFGGALGMLTTPLCIVAFASVGRGPSFALGVILPLLCAGDLFSMYHYWGKWRKDNLKYLIPGVVVGVCVGALLVGRFTPRQLNFAIGLIAVLFVTFQLVREKIFALEGEFQPSHGTGIPFGFATGVTSTFAHGAGPVVSMFLIAQRLPKEIFVGTSVLIFTWVNWIKLPFFIANGIITRETAIVGLWFLPLIPIGVWLGVWANRRMSEAFFVKFAYVLIFLAGIYLLAGFQPGARASTASPVMTNAAAQLDRGAIIRGNTNSPRMALVFTGHEYADILDELARRGWRASFFLTGHFLAQTNNRSLIERIAREGHYIGSHSDQHLLYCSWDKPPRTLVSREVFTQDLAANQAKVRGFAGVAPRYFLPPYEHYSEEIAQWTHDAGLVLVNMTPGTRSAADYTGEQDKNFVPSDTILQSIKAYSARDPNGLSGFILLLHTGAGPGRTDKFHTRFGEMASWIHEKNYRPVRIDELLAK